ncbi:MAG: right-handed parallel beta-helix repeat-containing protein [Thermoanaerobaculia bacterium]|nr:right-handed parallel beta-helix repeat-containing protein [Thermoanaerobaculia bacterium]
MKQLVLGLVYLVGTAAPSRAAVLTVPGDYSTIASAVAAANDGDTIQIGPGSYREAIVAYAKDLIFESTAGAQQTFLLGPASAVPSNPWIQISSFSTLRGFTLTSTPESTAWVNVEGNVVGVLPGALIEDNVFDGTDAGERFRAALSFNDSAGRVRGNIFRGWTRGETNPGLSVLEVVNGGVVEIENNLFLDNRATAVGLHGNFRPNRIVNNNFVGNRRAIWLGFAAGGAVLRNNILADNDVGLEVQTAAPSHTWTHNIVWGNSLDYVGTADPTGVDGNLRADPEFVAGQRLRLVAGSAAIDAGTNQDAPSKDFAGTPRPQDGNNDGAAAWDIGAAERISTVLEIPALGAFGAALLIGATALVGMLALSTRRRHDLA